MQAAAHQSFHNQACFAVDYDFATHRCYFFLVNVFQGFTTDAPGDPDDSVAAPVPIYLHCIIAAGVTQPASLGLQANPNVVHITLCQYIN